MDDAPFDAESGEHEGAAEELPDSDVEDDGPPPPAKEPRLVDDGTKIPRKRVPSSLDGWRILGCDPGECRPLSVAEDVGVSAKFRFKCRWISREEFNRSAFGAANHRRKVLEKRVVVADPRGGSDEGGSKIAIGDLKLATPSLKTAHVKDLESAFVFRSISHQTVAAFESSKEVLRIRHHRGIMKRKTMDRSINRLLSYPECIPVESRLPEDKWIFVAGRGRFAVEWQQHLRRTHPQILFVSINEANTSALCSRCRRPLLHVNPVRSSSAASRRLFPAYSIKQCKHCGVNGVYWNRDVNASINILNVFLHAHGHGGRPPEEFRIRRKQKRHVE